MAGETIRGNGPKRTWWGKPQGKNSSEGAGLKKHRWENLKEETSVGELPWEDFYEGVTREGTVKRGLGKRAVEKEPP